jgi:uncharacterized protein (TIGR02246 family)
MDRDEQAIRDLVQTWMRASTAGDLDRVLELMDDDVVFLGPGRPPMRGKAAFAEASRAMANMHIDGHAEIHEVRIFGDWAYCWNELSVAATPSGGKTVRRSGPALSILHKQPDGRWVIVRDANMLAPEK